MESTTQHPIPRPRHEQTRPPTRAPTQLASVSPVDDKAAIRLRRAADRREARACPPSREDLDARTRPSEGKRWPERGCASGLGRAYKTIMGSVRRSPLAVVACCVPPLLKKIGLRACDTRASCGECVWKRCTRSGGGHGRVCCHGATSAPSSLDVPIDLEQNVPRLLRQPLRCDF